MEDKHNEEEKKQPAQANSDVPSSAEKPLAEKSHAELERETRARLKHLDSDSAAKLLDEVVRRPVHGFANFLRAHAIVGLAIGFVLGTQVTLLATSLINSFLSPFLQLLTGKQGLKAQTFTLHFNGNSAVFHWGSFVFALIDFLFVVAVLYVIIKVLRLEKLDKES